MDESCMNVLEEELYTESGDCFCVETSIGNCNSNTCVCLCFDSSHDSNTCSYFNFAESKSSNVHVANCVEIC